MSDEFARGFRHTDIDADQSDDAVWRNAVLCSNCGTGFGEHCKVHLIPCCPGKCPKEPAG